AVVRQATDSGTVFEHRRIRPRHLRGGGGQPPLFSQTGTGTDLGGISAAGGGAAESLPLPRPAALALCGRAGAVDLPADGATGAGDPGPAVSKEPVRQSRTGGDKPEYWQDVAAIAAAAPIVLPDR